MSHITQIDLKIQDLDALQKACQRLGFEFLNHKEYRSFYGYQKCEHVIRVPGAQFEIGVNTLDGVSTLHWDSWSEGGLTKAVGKNAGILKQAYAAALTIKAARRAGYSVYEQQEEGKLTITLRREE